jgi:hypothetical protein
MTSKMPSLKKTNWKHFLIGFPIVFALLLGAQFGYERLDRLIIDLRPATSYFEYKSIEFVSVEDDKSLVFASTSLYKVSYPTFWNDILRCSDGTTFRFYSVQDTSAASLAPRLEYRKTEWNYNQPFPYGRTCYLDSTVSMSVKGIIKKQKITSPEFIIERKEQ